jgi:perosamine synthetase
VEPGYKLNLCDLLGALGSAQLKRCDQFYDRRHEIANRYLERFDRIEELENPPRAGKDSRHSWHLFILRIRPELLEVDRGSFIRQLKEVGIGTSVHFIPLHLHPFYARTYGHKPNSFPNAKDAFSRCISLPIYPDMTDGEVSRVMQAVEQIVYINRKMLIAA